MMSVQSSPRSVAIAVAPNGGRRTKSDHPGIPLGAAELARTAAECAEAGASMIHVHVRDRTGRHLLDAHAYLEAMAAIRTAVGSRLVLQITTEALGIYEIEAQMEVVRRVKPESASLALREFVDDAESEAEFSRFLGWMKSERIVPQIILYDPQEALQLAGMHGRGLIPYEEIPVLYVLGRYTAGQTSQPAELLPYLAPNMPKFAYWSVCAFGRHEAACVTAGALLGGDIRVGFENNLNLPDGRLAPSNAALVNVVAKAIANCGVASLNADGLRRAWSRVL